MIAPASRVDVSHLPDFEFDHRASMWWGTLAFIAVEGTTLMVCISTYFYLRRNFDAWPPPDTPLPALLPATLAIVVALASLVPAMRTARYGRAFDAAGVRRMLTIHLLFGLGLLILRVVEFLTLHTRWDSDAYGSIVWLTLGIHTTLILTDVMDTALLTAVFLRGREENKHFSGLADNSLYWYFAVASWVLVWLVVYISPRWL